MGFRNVILLIVFLTEIIITVLFFFRKRKSIISAGRFGSFSTMFLQQQGKEWPEGNIADMQVSYKYLDIPQASRNYGGGHKEVSHKQVRPQFKTGPEESA